jgi:hypothetical protein
MVSRVVFNNGIMEKSKQCTVEKLLEAAMDDCYRAHDKMAENVRMMAETASLVYAAEMSLKGRIDEAKKLKHVTHSQLIYTAIATVITSVSLAILVAHYG